MPFTDIVSYPVAGHEFARYWVQVNTFLVAGGGQAMVLPGGFDEAALLALVAQVEAATTLVNDQQTLVNTAINQIALLKAPIMERFKQLRRAFDAFLGGTKFAGTLPVTPRADAAGPNWIRPLEDAARLWGDVNASTNLAGVTLPLTLAGGYTLAQFHADSLALIVAIQTRQSIPTTLDPLVNERDAKMKALYDRCIQFRAAVQSQLPAKNPLLASLPVATPAKKQGAVAVSLAVYTEPATGLRKLIWSAPDASTMRMEIRFCAGAKYKDAGSRVVADVAPTDLQWTIPTELLPGAEPHWFKAVSVSATSNTAGSNAVKA